LFTHMCLCHQAA